MDKPGYTPGPWHVVPYGDGNALVICTEPDGNWRICFLATPGDSSGAWETIKADARLIAAAPDLVEALDGPDPDAPECIRPLSWLHSMIAHCKARGPAPDDDDPAAFHDMIGEVEAMYVRARAALSKALGEGQ